MSGNTHTLFEKNIFGNGGDMRCSSEMGGHQTIIKNGGVYTSAAENGGGPMRGRRPPEKGYPPLRVFFAPSLMVVFADPWLP